MDNWKTSLWNLLSYFKVWQRNLSYSWNLWESPSWCWNCWWLLSECWKVWFLQFFLQILDLWLQIFLFLLFLFDFFLQFSCSLISSISSCWSFHGATSKIHPVFVSLTATAYFHWTSKSSSWWIPRFSEFLVLVFKFYNLFPELYGIIEVKIILQKWNSRCPGDTTHASLCRVPRIIATERALVFVWLWLRTTIRCLIWEAT